MTPTRDVDELTDRLIDKRERLGYFLVTASTGVIVFTLNHDSPHLVPKGWPTKVLVAGLLTLVLSAAASLTLIYLRHQQYWRYLREVEPEARSVQNAESQMTWVSRLMQVSFPLGMLLIVVAYGRALLVTT